MGTCLCENAYPITMQHFQLKIDIIATKIGKNVGSYRLLPTLTEGISMFTRSQTWGGHTPRLPTLTGSHNLAFNYSEFQCLHVLRHGVGTPLRQYAYPLTRQHFQLKIDIISSKIGKNMECYRRLP